MGPDMAKAVISWVFTMRNNGSARLPGTMALGTLVVIFKSWPSTSMEAGSKTHCPVAEPEGTLQGRFDQFRRHILAVGKLHALPDAEGQVRLSSLTLHSSARRGTSSPCSSNLSSVSPWRNGNHPAKYCSGLRVSAKLVTPMVISLPSVELPPLVCSPPVLSDGPLPPLVCPPQPASRKATSYRPEPGSVFS